MLHKLRSDTLPISQIAQGIIESGKSTPVVTKTTFEVSIPNISVSICDFVGPKRREEIANLTLKGISLSAKTTKEDLELEFTLNRV